MHASVQRSTVVSFPTDCKQELVSEMPGPPSMRRQQSSSAAPREGPEGAEPPRENPVPQIGAWLQVGDVTQNAGKLYLELRYYSGGRTYHWCVEVYAEGSQASAAHGSSGASGSR